MTLSSPPPLPLALTMGDPAGIGPDLAIEAWRLRVGHAIPPFAVFGDAQMIAERAVMLRETLPLQEIDTIEQAVALFPDALPVVPVDLSVPCRAGTPDPGNAGAVIRAIEHAVSVVEDGRAAAVVTNPIAKSVLYQAGFIHPGHTEFLAALADARRPGERHRPVMLLADATLKVVPLTVHVPLADVPGLVTRALIVETALILHAALIRDFAIRSPRLAVAGLNPHAGEGGEIGREEIDVISPAIAELQHKGLDVKGPLSADTMFHGAARAHYDAAICMYHDQALIPIKTLAFDTGVNVTLGLPFVRTSPDHGTAFDLAGSGRASPSSLVSALKLASRMAAARAATACSASSETRSRP
ncbi:MAG: 4-hydroxythreonine-4-phosphate dehydrogenase PdxA [Hyphomicrobiaceae bacterium]